MFQQPVLETFAYWIQEREKIRIAKESGAPKPWSDDPVFQTTYFCNVHREDDKVTKWIRHNINLYQHKQFEYMMCVARLLNRIETLERIGKPWDPYWSPRSMYHTLKEMQSNGETIWGGAYVVTTHGQKMDKLDYFFNVTMDIYRGPLHDDMMTPYLTLERAHGFITRYEGFGSFMAAQVVADLKNTEGHALQFAEDWWNWSAYGPGSIRGLQWLSGGKVTPRTYGDFIKDLHVAVEELVYPIHMCEQDLQNCLCEFDKYMRVKNNTGRSKRKYHGTR